MERTAFDFGISARYGLENRVGRLYYDWVKGSRLAHPDTVRYIEGLLAQPSSTP